MHNLAFRIGSELDGIADQLETFAFKNNINYLYDKEGNKAVNQQPMLEPLQEPSQGESGSADGEMILLDEPVGRNSVLKRLSAAKLLQGMDSNDIRKKNDLLGGMNLEDLMTRRPTCKQKKGHKPTKFVFENGESLDIPEDSDDAEQSDSQKMDLLEAQKFNFAKVKKDIIPVYNMHKHKASKMQVLESKTKAVSLERDNTRETKSYKMNTPLVTPTLENTMVKEIDESQMTQQMNRASRHKQHRTDNANKQSLRVFERGPLTPIKRPDSRLLKKRDFDRNLDPVYAKQMITRYSRTISPVRQSPPEYNDQFSRNSPYANFKERRQIKASASKSSQMVAKSVDYNMGGVPGKGHIYRRYVFSGETPNTSSLSPTQRKQRGFGRPLHTMSHQNFAIQRRGLGGRQGLHTRSHQALHPVSFKQPNFRNFHHNAETRSMPGSPLPDSRSRRFIPSQSQNLRRNHAQNEPQTTKKFGNSYYLPRGLVRQASEILPKNRIWGSPVPTRGPLQRRIPNSFKRPISPITRPIHPRIPLHQPRNRNQAGANRIKATQRPFAINPANQLPIRTMAGQPNRRGRNLPRYNPEAMAQISRTPRPQSTMSVRLHPNVLSPAPPTRTLSETDLAHRLTNLFKKTLVYSSKIESLKKKILRQNPGFSAEPFFLVFASYPEHLAAEDLFMLFRAFKLKLAPLAVGKIMLYLASHHLQKLLEAPEVQETGRRTPSKHFAISPSGRLISQRETLTESEHLHALNYPRVSGGILNHSEQPLAPEDRLIPKEFADSKRFLNFIDFRFLLESQREDSRPPQSNFRLAEDLYIKEIDYHIIRQILILLTRKIKDMGSIIRGLRPYGTEAIFAFLKNFETDNFSPEHSNQDFEQNHHPRAQKSRKSRKPYLDDLQPRQYPNQQDSPENRQLRESQQLRKKQRKIEARRVSRRERDFHIEVEEEPADDEDADQQLLFEANHPPTSYYKKAKRQIQDPRDTRKNQLHFKPSARAMVDNPILDMDMLNPYHDQESEPILTLLGFQRFLEEREIQFVGNDLRLVMSSFGSDQEWIDLQALHRFIGSPVWDL